MSRTETLNRGIPAPRGQAGMNAGANRPASLREQIRESRQRGFSFLEIIFVVTIALIVGVAGFFIF